MGLMHAKPQTRDGVVGTLTLSGFKVEAHPTDKNTVIAKFGLGVKSERFATMVKANRLYFSGKKIVKIHPSEKMDIVLATAKTTEKPDAIQEVEFGHNVLSGDHGEKVIGLLKALKKATT
ncbi:MAG: hypothetical protein V1817_03260 [Candidatus Micrarchaeota archaeon]